MAKKYPDAEFKDAVKALNKVLKAADEDIIKVVTRKKADIYNDFTKKMESFIDEKRTSELPEEAIDFYNTYVANDEATDEENGTDGADSDAGADEEKVEEKKKPAGKKGKKATGKKPAATKKEKKEKSNKPSDKTREFSCVEALKSGGSMDQVVKKADDIYVKQGGKSNESQSKRLMERAIKYLYYAGVLEIKDDHYKLTV